MGPAFARGPRATPAPSAIRCYRLREKAIVAMTSLAVTGTCVHGQTADDRATTHVTFLRPCTGHRRTRGCESHRKRGGPGDGIPVGNIQAILSTFTPLKTSSLDPLMPPSSGGLLMSTVAPKWALDLSTQHCAQGSHLHVPHQYST